MASLAQTIAWLRDGILGVLFCFIGPFLPKLEPQGKDLAGKTAIVTGAISGVGYGLALQLAEMGATVYLACRNKNKAEQAKKDMMSTIWYKNRRAGFGPWSPRSLAAFSERK
ncbi:hypothetical protein AC579_6418 [Pseudocercospora musae]|uniref:Ketoreductase (KR) domain-containing protein n=1 Tax=Pseudocercospora musae TaxID=113226 RepID=A0A139GTK3_9PEZI|nr:hypothetical protein AC579_6418 [Pseudocercospora musae]